MRAMASFPSPSLPLPPSQWLPTRNKEQGFAPGRHHIGMVVSRDELPSASTVDREEESIERRFLDGGFSHTKHLSELSTLRIGGPCRYFLEVRSPSQLVAAIRCCRERSLPFLVLGKGSNCLFDDRGFDGCVLLNRIDTMEWMGAGVYRAGSGYPFNRLGLHCSNEGYSGLEFAGGIPGTVGGATFMNAGADGQDTASATESVEIVTTDGEILCFKRGDLAFGYRKSIFQEMEGLAAILAVTFQLAESGSAQRRQQDYLERRWRTQPTGERSAGSIFRNPPGSDMSAGELIEKAGMKGFKLGGAKVSEVHANFFINFNNATSGDMLTLVSHVKERVRLMSGIQLEEEVRFIPYSTI